MTFEIRRFEQHFGYFYGISRVPDEKAFFFGRGQNAPESRAKQALFSLRLLGTDAKIIVSYEKKYQRPLLQQQSGLADFIHRATLLTIGACVGLSRSSRKPEDHSEGLQMDDDFVDVFPSAGGVGDSPVRTATQEHLGSGSPWPRPSISLSIPGLDTGGAAAAVSPAIPGSRGVATPSPAKEAELRSARGVSSGARDEDVVESPSPSPFPNRIGMALTIDPGGECVPTELEKKRAKLEKFRYECSEVGAAGSCLPRPWASCSLLLLSSLLSLLLSQGGWDAMMMMLSREI